MYNGFKVGDRVAVNKRGGEKHLYSLTSVGSTGVITSFNVDKRTELPVAFIKFDKSWIVNNKTITFPEEPLYLYTIKNISNKKKTIIGEDDKKLFLCNDCGLYHTKLKKQGNNFICNDCLSYYKICICCKKLFNKGLYEELKDVGIVCNSCKKKRYRVCEDCGRIGLKEEYSKISGNHICKYCIDSFYKNCGICNKLHKLSKMRKIKKLTGDTLYCPNCYYIKCPIKNYSYSPENIKLFKNKWEGGEKLFLGMELEVMTRKTNEKTILSSKFQKFLVSKKLIKFFYCKDDSSLKDSSGRAGWEIVTNPFTLQTRKLLNFKLILNWLRDNNLRSYGGGKCGIHVHLSRDFFKPKEINKLRLFFSNNWEKIYTFSKRRGTGKNYVGKEVFNLKDFKYGKRQGGRHCAVNINSNKPTVEIRVFRGTLNFTRLLAILMFCDSVAYFVKSHSAPIIANKKRSWEIYKKFLQKENRYGHLIKYFKNVGL